MISHQVLGVSWPKLQAGPAGAAPAVLEVGTGAAASSMTVTPPVSAYVLLCLNQTLGCVLQVMHLPARLSILQIWCTLLDKWCVHPREFTQLGDA